MMISGIIVRTTLRPAAEHGDDLIEARHAAQAEDEPASSSMPDGERDEDDLRELRKVEKPDGLERGVPGEELLHVVLQIEDQPDGEEAEKAKEERLDEISQNVTVEQLHEGSRIERWAVGFAKRKLARASRRAPAEFTVRRAAAGPPACG